MGEDQEETLGIGVLKEWRKGWREEGKIGLKFGGERFEAGLKYWADPMNMQTCCGS